MDPIWNQALYSQFTAAINMLEKSITACPDEHWDAVVWTDPDLPAGLTEFWYVAYHTLFWLDLYLTGKEQGFTPPEPFDLNELRPEGVLPERHPTKYELLKYLSHCRQKCQEILSSLTDEKARQPCEVPWSKGEISYAELLLDNMRHVQEHGAQLNLFLGQHASIRSKWVGRVKSDPT